MFCNEFMPDWFWEIDPPSSGAEALGTKIEVNSTLTPTRNYKDGATAFLGDDTFCESKMAKGWAECEYRQERPAIHPQSSHVCSPSTQYVVLNDVQSDIEGRVCKHHVASSFDFQLLGVTTEAIQTSEMKGKNLYVFYQSPFTK